MNKIKAVAKDIIANWKTPAPGKYVSYKELVAYSVGGMGVQFIIAMFNLLAMAASSWLVGIVYGIKPFDLALILNIATIFSIIMQPLKSILIDYNRSKSGKARPWLFWLALPTAILTVFCAFIPLNWSYTAKVATLGTAYVLLFFIANFYLGMYGQLAQLLSPNTDERAVVISISSIVYSLAPTITGFVMPLIASGFDEGLRDITVYRIAFPVFSILGLIMSYLCYFGTKEKVVVSKQEKERIKFWDGMKKIVNNRYFWIINVNAIFVVFRGASTMVTNWIWVYLLQNDALTSLLVTVLGTASLIGMLIGPILCKFLGKKWTVILTNAIYAVASVAMIFAVKSAALLIICIYLMNCAMAVQIITAPAMNADALDYQQWKTGDRLEGISGNFTIITSIIAIGTNLVIPAVMESFGLLNNYDVLFNPEVRDPLFRILGGIGAIGAVLSIIPYLFWNLTSKKHAAIIEDLKQRAIAEDRAAGIEETEEELEARLAGITVEELRAEKARKAENWAEANNVVACDNEDNNQESCKCTCECEVENGNITCECTCEYENDDNSTPTDKQDTAPIDENTDNEEAQKDEK